MFYIFNLFPRLTVLENIIEAPHRRGPADRGQAGQFPFAAFAAEVDMSPEQPGRVRVEPGPEVIALIPEGHPWVAAGKFAFAS